MVSRLAGRLVSLPLLVIALVIRSAPAPAQAWDDPRARLLVERAVARRSAQFSDTGLAGYTARARGTLEFLVQIGDSSLLPPRIVRSAELAVDVHWTAPNISRQVVVGERDTSLVPMDIGFYSDRYGVVQSNFPDRIRLGDGQDVSDVPHPVSAAGLGVYEYALRDSIAFNAGAGRTTLYQIAFRPRNPSVAAAVGAAYLDRTTAEIVRLDLTFTRAAILDKRITVLSIVLENALIQGRYWLPHRQDLEVQRAGTVLDFPTMGIVRGHWAVCCYDLTPAAARAARALAASGAPAITFRSPAELRTFTFADSVFANLHGDASALRSEDVERVESIARQTIGRAALDRIQRASFAAAGISDFVRFDRAEGFALGGGAVWRAASGAELRGHSRYGLDDRRLKGDVALTLPTNERGDAVRLFVSRSYRDVGDVMETSGVKNSIAAQEFAADYTDPYDVRSAGIGWMFAGLAARWRADLAYQTHRALQVRAQPVFGAFDPLPAVAPVNGVQATLAADGSQWSMPLAVTLRASAALRAGVFHYDAPTIGAPRSTHVVRSFFELDAQRGFGDATLTTRTYAAAVAFRGLVLPQDLVYLGGPTTAPGYAFHELVGRAALAQRVELSHPVSLLPITIPRLGTYPVISRAGAFAHAAWVDGVSGAAARRGGWYPSLGVGADLFMGVASVEVARGLRGGRWTFSIDAARALWPIL